MSEPAKPPEPIIQRTSRKLILFIMGLIVALFLAAIFLTPSRSRHSELADPAQNSQTPQPLPA